MYVCECQCVCVKGGEAGSELFHFLAGSQVLLEQKGVQGPADGLGLGDGGGVYGSSSQRFAVPGKRFTSSRMFLGCPQTAEKAKSSKRRSGRSRLASAEARRGEARAGGQPLASPQIPAGRGPGGGAPEGDASRGSLPLITEPGPRRIKASGASTVQSNQGIPEYSHHGHGRLGFQPAG
jgi:hypothetical protein